jgi:hypothetical protein
MERIVVEFHGEGSGEAHLTWGQLSLWLAGQRSGVPSIVGGVSPIPAGHTVEAIATSLRFIMGRHQSLRTTIHLGDDGEPRQVVAERGEIALEVYDAEVDGHGADPADVAEQVFQRYVRTPFDYPTDWPVRMAAIRHRGEVTHTAVAYLHTSVDGLGMNVLIADLAAMDPVTGLATAPLDGIQPLELAGQQRRPAAQRQNRASIRHWEKVLRTAAPDRFGRSTDPRVPRFQLYAYRSPAARLAVRVIAARHAMDVSPVLLAGFAIGLARVTGINPVVTMIAVSNRFRPGFATSVSPLAQVSPCLVDLAGLRFDEALAHAGRAAMRTYLHAYYDPRERFALVAAVNEERGTTVDLGCVFNDRRQPRPDDDAPMPGPEEIRAALPRAELRHIDRPDLPSQKLYFSVDDVDDVLDLSVAGDTHHVSPADMAAILHGVEAALVDGAIDPTTPALGPVGRAPDPAGSTAHRG